MLITRRIGALVALLVLSATASALASSASATPSNATLRGSIDRIWPNLDDLLVIDNTDVYVTSATVITLDGRAATFPDLLPGDQATIISDHFESGYAIKVTALTTPVRKVRATLQGTDRRHGFLMVVPQGGQPETLWTDPTTAISRNGVAATLSQLKPGDNLMLSIRSRTAIAINASGPGRD